MSLANWSAEVAKVVEAADDLKRLAAGLVDALLVLTPAVMGYAALYRKDRLPRRLHLHPDGLHFPDPWADGLYVLDPFHAAYKAGRSGCFPLRKVMPPGFERTEYFRHFYIEPGCVDELVHLTVLPGQGAIAIGLTRSTEQRRFSDEEVARHEAAHPLVAAFSRRAWSLVSHHVDPAEEELALDVERAIQRFGEDLLTPREREVIDLVLRGHDTRSVASQLSIASDTVKLHRKHAYAKLRVSSQGELFYKFLESLNPPVGRAKATSNE